MYDGQTRVHFVIRTYCSAECKSAGLGFGFEVCELGLSGSALSIRVIEEYLL